MHGRVRSHVYHNVRATEHADVCDNVSTDTGTPVDALQTFLFSSNVPRRPRQPPSYTTRQYAETADLRRPRGAGVLEPLRANVTHSVICEKTTWAEVIGLTGERDIQYAAIERYPPSHVCLRLPSFDRHLTAVHRSALR
jgi:hypothetical protein